MDFHVVVTVFVALFIVLSISHLYLSSVRNREPATWHSTKTMHSVYFYPRLKLLCNIRMWTLFRRIALLWCLEFKISDNSVQRKLFFSGRGNRYKYNVVTLKRWTVSFACTEKSSLYCLAQIWGRVFFLQVRYTYSLNV